MERKNTCSSHEIPEDFQKIEVVVTSEGKSETHSGDYVLVVTLTRQEDGIMAQSNGVGVMGLDYAIALRDVVKSAVDSATKKSVNSIVRGLLGDN